MRAKAPFWFMLTIATMLFAGCTPIQPVTATPDPAPTSLTTPVRTPVLTPLATMMVTDAPITQEDTFTMTKPSSNPQVVQAIKDLAVRAAVSGDSITVVSAEPVVWPDGGLGCPQPGMVYPQVQQDGMRIILAVAGREYHYHSGETRGPFLCENPSE